MNINSKLSAILIYFFGSTLVNGSGIDSGGAVGQIRPEYHPGDDYNEARPSDTFTAEEEEELWRTINRGRSRSEAFSFVEVKGNDGFLPMPQETPLRRADQAGAPAATPRQKGSPRRPNGGSAMHAALTSSPARAFAIQGYNKNKNTSGK